MNRDISFVKDWIEPQSRVLDVGCGDGSLLIKLQEQLDILAMA